MISKRMFACSSVLLATVLSIAARRLVSTVEAAGPRPDFQMPVLCGQVWDASTFDAHSPDPDSLDLTFRDENQARGQPVLASAAGVATHSAVREAQPDQDTGLYGVHIDHGDGWETRYEHMEVPNDSPIAVGRRVAEGEQIGRVGKSGSATIHLHYTQVRDGEAVRARFNGAAVETREGDSSTWGRRGKPDAEQLISYNCAGSVFANWVDIGRRMMLRYGPLFKAVELSRLKEDAQISLVRFEDWGEPDWTHISPFRAGGKPHALFYKSSNGHVRFVRFDAQSTEIKILKNGTWQGGWTHLLPYRRNNKTYLVMYNSLDGRMVLRRIEPSGQATAELDRRQWEKGRTTLLHLVAGASHYLLSYKAATGRVRIARIEGDGADTRFQQVWNRKRLSGWTTMLPVAVDAGLHVFGYNAASGNAKLWRFDFTEPGLSATADLAMLASWTSFSTHPFSTGGQLLAYNAATGQVRGFRVEADGSGLRRLWTDTWARNLR